MQVLGAMTVNRDDGTSRRRMTNITTVSSVVPVFQRLWDLPLCRRVSAGRSFSAAVADTGALVVWGGGTPGFRKTHGFVVDAVMGGTHLCVCSSKKEEASADDSKVQ